MMFGTREVFSYFQCGRCGCLQIARIPEDLDRHYPPLYGPFQREGDAAAGSWLRRALRGSRDRYALTGRGFVGRALHARIPHDELRSLSRVRGLERRSRVLEVGCGTGALLRRLAGLGFSHLLGVDPHLDAGLHQPNGVLLRRGDIAAIDGEWDLVMFHHSFEHVPDPPETLAHARRLLARGGTILLRMPTVSSYAWEHYGVDWVELDAPRHLHVHSHDSVARLAAASGLRVTTVHGDSRAFELWGSEQYARDIPLRAPDSYAMAPGRSMFSRRDIARFGREAARLNREGRGGRAGFYLAAAER